jgi:hypothetical protein
MQLSTDAKMFVISVFSMFNQRLSRACIVHLVIKRSSTNFLFVMPIGNPRWLPPQVIVLTQNHMGKIQKYILL